MDTSAGEGVVRDRFVLGTVQLGLSYGRNRSLPVMSQQRAFRILDSAWSVGVRAFDTAEAYGASAERLRSWSDQRGNADDLEVVTKCVVNLPGLSAEIAARSAQAALSRFDGICRVVLLTHGAVDAALWPAITSAAHQHSASAGQSVYTSQEVADACEMRDMSRIQAPANILDGRAIDARSGAGVPLDIRSLYLQGVLLEAPEQAGRRAPGAGKISSALRAAAAALDTNLAPLLVAGMLHSIGELDRVVLGVDDESQLDVISAALDVPADIVLQFRDAVRPIRDDPDTRLMIDPRTWPA